MGGKLFLHIGRNKVGSTTLQKTWLRNIDTLRTAGIQYAMFGQTSPPGHDFPSFASHLEMAQHVESHPDTATLVSHEGLCCFLPVFAKAMATDLARLNVRILFYVRPYRDWVVSNYAFNILLGLQRGDFDSYLEALGDAARFWPALEVWGEAIGWDRVRVRSLHSDDLVAGDLATDGMVAIGLDPQAIDPTPPQNGSPIWVSTEIVRFLSGGASIHQPIDEHSLSDIRGLADIVDHEVRRAASALGVPLERRSYLTADQSARLRALYDHDLDLLALRTGRQLRRDDLDTPPRLFMPSAEHVPPALLETLKRNLGGALGQKTAIARDRFDAFLALSASGI